MDATLDMVRVWRPALQCCMVLIGAVARRQLLLTSFMSRICSILLRRSSGPSGTSSPVDTLLFMLKLSVQELVLFREGFGDELC